MSAEQEALTQAALQFSEAIKAERERTTAQLETERNATLDILAALRRENVKRSESIGQRFAFGVVIGGLVGVVAAILITPKAGTLTRRDLNQRWQIALDAFKKASSASEAELWADFRKRLKA